VIYKTLHLANPAHSHLSKNVYCRAAYVESCTLQFHYVGCGDISNCGSAFPFSVMPPLLIIQEIKSHSIYLNSIFLYKAPITAQYQVIIIFEYFLLSLSLRHFYHSFRSFYNPANMSEPTKRITSEEVAAQFKDNIKGKVILITGCSPNGLGAETARAIATQNPALLILAGRNKVSIEETEKNIKEKIPDAGTRFLMLDLASLSSVRKAAAEVNSYAETIDVLINNAAIMAGPYEKTEDGFESQFATNHLGHFLLTNLLLEKMIRKGPGARIINVTSNGYGFGGIRFEDPNFEVRYRSCSTPQRL
jgi:short chain dehydrogenase